MKNDRDPASQAPTVARWSRLNEVFNAAVLRPQTDRRRFLETECGDDAMLRAEVESLLNMHRDGENDGASSLREGSRIGDYAITGFIAAGGMGEVYRARDTRLGRDVALKILPASYFSDVDRHARFEREGRLLASLTHPHIATIYGLEEDAGVCALVLELVDGETLADRIARGKVPVDEALRIARQIADALENAHDRGIIHRDLKPANVKITRDGVVKVLDFGLARLVDGAVDASAVTLGPTLTGGVTRTGAGLILGTPAYMSPEQARGETADQRSDIWAFGCVLYEMLTGRRAFAGDTVTDTFASVLAREPDLDALPDNVPTAVRTLVARCLSKDRVQRLPHASVVRFLLHEPLSEPTQTWRAWTRSLLQNRTSRSAVIVAVVLLAGAARIGFRYLTADPSDRPGSPLDPAVVARAGLDVAREAAGLTAPSARFVISPPPGQVFLSRANSSVAISADGSSLAYIASDGGAAETASIFVRRLDSLAIAALPDTAGAGGAFFSPDGRSIGFYTRSELKRITIGDRTATTLYRRMSGARGAAWLPDGTIVFNTNDSTTGLLRIRAVGGEVEVLTRPDRAKGEGDHIFPSVLPGGRALLFTIVSPNESDEEIAVLDMGTGRYKRLLRGQRAEYLESGHLLYLDDAVVRVVGFDQAKLEVVGDPVAVSEQALSATTDFAVARNGTLAYIPSGAGESLSRSLVWVDRFGHQTPVAMPFRRYGVARISPDGRRAVVDIRENDSDLWMWDFGLKTLGRVTFTGNARNPVWMPDGQRVIYGTTTGDIVAQRVDGTGVPEHLVPEHLAATGELGIPKAITPDERFVVLAGGTVTDSTVSLLTLGPTPHIESLISATNTVRNPALSPDGHWLAYDSNETGRSEVYVRPFPRVDDGRWQVSTDGAVEPSWAPNGREMFYISNGTLTSVSLDGGPVFRWGKPVPVLNTRSFESPAGRHYDISPDGKRFLFIQKIDAGAQMPAQASIVVVLNWYAELRRVLP